MKRNRNRRSMFDGVFAFRMSDLLQRKDVEKMSKCTAKDVTFVAQNANFFAK
jgi:hypothetical protein